MVSVAAEEEEWVPNNAEDNGPSPRRSKRQATAAALAAPINLAQAVGGQSNIVQHVRLYSQCALMDADRFLLALFSLC